jgi:hypothetical protein
MPKAIERRQTQALWIFPHFWRPDYLESRWPKLTKMMNLPESVRSQ